MRPLHSRSSGFVQSVITFDRNTQARHRVIEEHHDSVAGELI